MSARDELLRRNAKYLAMVLALFKAAGGRLKPTVVRFSEAIADVGLRGLPALRLTTQGNELVRAMVSEFDEVGAELASILEEVIAAELGLARGDFANQMAALLPTASTAWMAQNIRYATNSQIMSLFGYLRSDGPLIRYLTSQYGYHVTQQIAGALIAGLVGGKSPRETAAFVMGKMGLGLNEAMTLTRTTQLWAYRSAAHANYLANSHVLEGWIWDAELDDRVCLSCVYMHGSFHTLDEILNDHHQGRCAAIPVTKKCSELGLDCEDYDLTADHIRGEDWFNSLPSWQQLAMMGPGIYNAWVNGDFEFSQLSVEYEDPVWGVMRRQATLQELTNAK